MSPLLVGAALGATSAYILDPQQGRRRRALMRDKVVSGLNDSRRFAGAARRDLRSRAEGIKAGLSARARSLRGEPVMDDVLCARVLSKIGRCSSHPGAVEVTALDGRVVLTGDILQREVDRLVGAARAVPGVQHVENQLRVHETADHISALQGAGTGPYGEPWEVFEETWTPGVRALVGGAGVGSLLYALARGGIGALVPLAIGATFLAFAVNASPRQR